MPNISEEVRKFCISDIAKSTAVLKIRTFIESRNESV